MNLQTLAAEHRAAVDKGETADFWEWLEKTKGARGASLMDIQASVAGVTLARKPEPENFDAGFAGKALALDADSEGPAPDFNIPSGADLTQLMADYTKAKASGSWTPRAGSGDLWHYIAWRYPGGSGAASSGGGGDYRPSQRGAMSVSELMTLVNAEEKQAQRGNSRANGHRPNQRGAAPVEDIMQAVNAEAKAGRL